MLGRDTADDPRGSSKQMSTSPQKQKKMWFHALRVGIGWGLPTCWQGWAVYVGYAVLALASSVICITSRRLMWWWWSQGVLNVALFVICWLKGPRLRWRWGDDDASRQE